MLDMVREACGRTNRGTGKTYEHCVPDKGAQAHTHTLTHTYTHSLYIYTHTHTYTHMYIHTHRQDV